MKTTITSEGVLAIQAETPVEDYALNKWREENAPIIHNMIINMNVVGVDKIPVVTEWPDLYKFKPSSGNIESHACCCIGPQPGQTKCPCMLRNNP